jgi:hypothetical protein
MEETGEREMKKSLALLGSLLVSSPPSAFANAPIFSSRQSVPFEDRGN